MSPDNTLATALDRVRIIATASEYDACMSSLFDTAASATVVVDFLNQHAGNMLARNAEFCENFMAADIILRDGIGTQLAFKLCRRDSGLNMNGTDFIPKLIDAFIAHHNEIAHGARTALICFGTREPWLLKGARKLAGAYSGPIVIRDGFRTDAEYFEVLQPYHNHYKIIVLGMGMPRQEALAQAFKRADIGPALILCGGAIIDFAAGRFARAPQWMRQLGMEWLFRLANEPRRLFHRYVIGIPLFLLAALRAAAPLSAAKNASIDVERLE